MKGPSPNTTADLQVSERRLVLAMQAIGFGRLERLKIRDGEPILDPWPATVRSVKFDRDASTSPELPEEFTLKCQHSELFEYIRGVDTGEIRVLEIRHGLPFSMEIGLPDSSGANGGRHG